MHFSATVRDLSGLDLAYAPPFGAAKDPVHMAAFVACNELDEIELMLDADAPLQDEVVLDVRTKNEVERDPIAGTGTVIHIPVDELRDRIGELDPATPLVACCGVGVRGHIASRILKQAGYQVRNLSGGAMVRKRAWRPEHSSD